MHSNPGPSYLPAVVLAAALGLLFIFPFVAADSASNTPLSPSVYLNFNEGSGNLAFDASGSGNTGTIYGNVYRVDNAGCVRALVFNGEGSYVSIPYTSKNHPSNGVTVSLWFYVNSTAPQTLISTYADGGGYRLGFDEGNDLFWTLGINNPAGSISVVLPHEYITPGQWHQVTGTYDGQTAQIYFDGILRNQVNASGAIRYVDNNSVIIGAEAGPGQVPEFNSPNYLTGGIDEVRIYDGAISYSQEMEDRYQCTAETGTGILPLPVGAQEQFLTSGSLTLSSGETVTRRLTFSNLGEVGTWHITIPPGSQLSVSATDAYPAIYPDEWYVELRDQDTLLGRVVAFPVPNNAPATGVIGSGNATAIVHYFGGPGRFPASLTVTFASTVPENPAPSMPKVILQYPIIVIYSASWATLIALIVVIVWLHHRRMKK